ncbi:4a-hydroxytetrahydrobiopterin dehydratase [Paenibacillus ehimensis]|uniref:4a-hydroxytetrahydrobiopterin dehydratase n=1 Tax=Paenibacillus ehimensis TaxID=79264 RepID=A0ABT8VIA7_9BACL|nr:4a-hydroxytetrahydrobiopterin dehydratase [Paenibacillus ehimensis]MDO3680725.1 4a-hydroxytetrahydrobiopterin dehydratase [Paenibacillus ehimensis]
MGSRLTAEEVKARLSGLEGWSMEEGKWLVKKYRFPAFAGSIAFVNRIADIAEAMNHHPMIAIDYRVVTLRLTSWHAGGLTELDCTSVARYDEAYAGSADERTP